jgi:hypothetical protein
MTTDNQSALAAALAKVQERLPSIRKEETGLISGKTKDGQPFSYQYKYADLSDVTDAIMPLLGVNGLAFSAYTKITERGFVLLCELMHEGGESRTAEYPLPQQGKPQEIGSAITYGRRYMLCAMTGIAPGGDDDDAAAAHRSYDHSPQEPAPPPDPKVEAVSALRTVVRAKGLGEDNVPAAFQAKMQVPIQDATPEQVTEYTRFVESTGSLSTELAEQQDATETQQEAGSEPPGE